MVVFSAVLTLLLLLLLLLPAAVVRFVVRVGLRLCGGTEGGGVWTVVADEFIWNGGGVAGTLLGPIKTSGDGEPCPRFVVMLPAAAARGLSEVLELGADAGSGEAAGSPGLVRFQVGEGDEEAELLLTGDGVGGEVITMPVAVGEVPGGGEELLLRLTAGAEAGDGGGLPVRPDVDQLPGGAAEAGLLLLVPGA
jgi:hypothetical protein